MAIFRMSRAAAGRPAVKLVLFDCDGTLVDSAGFIHACMERTFVEDDLTAPRLEQTKSIIGLSLPIAIDRLLGGDTKSRVDRLTASYRENFVQLRSENAFHEPLYDGIADLIHMLNEDDHILTGVVTGKSRRGLKMVLEKHGLCERFHCLRTADDCPSKPHPAMVIECCDEIGVDPSAAVVIGDTSFDMEMAKLAGADGIGVSWGYHAPNVLVKAGASLVLQKPADLLDYLDKVDA